MDLRKLINRLEKIEYNQLTESITQADITAAIQTLPSGLDSPEQKRAVILNDISWKENLPGLYDPITGNFVRKQQPNLDTGSVSISDPRWGMDEINKTLAALGLNVGKLTSTAPVAATSAPNSADSYKVTNSQTSQDDVTAKLERLNFLVGQLKNTTLIPPIKESLFKLSISKQLIESFDYQLDEDADAADALATAAATAAAIKIGGKIVPGLGTILGLKDAKERYDDGDANGALLSAVSAVAAIGGAATSFIWLPIDAFLLSQDAGPGALDSLIDRAKKLVNWNSEETPSIEIKFPKGGITPDMIASLPEDAAVIFKELGWNDPEVIKEYQRENGLEESGIIDAATVAKLQTTPIADIQDDDAAENDDTNTDAAEEEEEEEGTSEDGVLELQKSLYASKAETADGERFNSDSGKLDIPTIQALQYVLSKVATDSMGQPLKVAVTGELDTETRSAIKNYVNSTSQTGTL